MLIGYCAADRSGIRSHVYFALFAVCSMNSFKCLSRLRAAVWAR